MKINCLKVVENLRKKHKIKTPITLTIIQVGSNYASEKYIQSKVQEADKWNIKCSLRFLSKSCTTEDVIEDIQNSIAYSDGIIVQLPLPEHIDTQRVIDSIPKEMNVDGFKQTNQELLFEPCTPKGIITLLETLTDLESKKVTLIGRGKTVGEPLINMLLNKNCTLTVCHSRTKIVDLQKALINSDIVISAVGVHNLFSYQNVPNNCIVIDAGISRLDGKQVGDFDHKGLEHFVDIQYTPYTNGVGKLTVASLMINTIKAHKMKKGDL